MSPMPVHPQVLVFDVNGTLSDTAALSGAFAEVGADPRSAQVWFASILRDGIAISAAGRNAPFADVARALLPSALAGQRLDRPFDAAEQHIMGALTALPPRPDVASGVRALQHAGFRLVTLTNGSTAITERLLATAGVRDAFERLCSVEDASGWKPTAGAYRSVVGALDVRPEEMMLVAAHPWDVEGAAAAGLRTAYVDREHLAYPTPFRRPDLEVGDLLELADRLTGDGHG